jgi:hypothetical protein
MTLSLRPLRLLGVAGLLLAATAAQAQNSRHDRNFNNLDRRNHETYTLDQRFRALGGEAFHIRGDLRVTLNVREQRGDVRITGAADGNDLVLTHEPNGIRYRLAGSPGVDVTIQDARRRDARDFRSGLEFRAVSQDGRQDYRVTLNLRGSVRPDGTVRAEVTSIQLAPR